MLGSWGWKHVWMVSVSRSGRQVEDRKQALVPGLCLLSPQGWSTSVASGGFYLRLGTLRTQRLRM